MPPANQKIEDLNKQDTARLVRQRTVIEKYPGNSPHNLSKHKAAAGKPGLRRGRPGNNIFNATQTYAFQCMGIIPGGAPVQHPGPEWAAVDDEYGRDPCLQLPGSTVVLFPLTMISKRIERGENPDALKLFNRIANEVESLKNKADKIAK